MEVEISDDGLSPYQLEQQAITAEEMRAESAVMDHPAVKLLQSRLGGVVLAGRVQSMQFQNE